MTGRFGLVHLRTVEKSLKGVASAFIITWDRCPCSEENARAADALAEAVRARLTQAPRHGFTTALPA
jgi:hypothetical protein